MAENVSLNGTGYICSIPSDTNYIFISNSGPYFQMNSINWQHIDWVFEYPEKSKKKKYWEK